MDQMVPPRPDCRELVERGKASDHLPDQAYSGFIVGCGASTMKN
jgi:hypothetical protein